MILLCFGICLFLISYTPSFSRTPCLISRRFIAMALVSIFCNILGCRRGLVAICIFTSLCLSFCNQFNCPCILHVSASFTCLFAKLGADETSSAAPINKHSVTNAGLGYWRAGDNVPDYYTTGVEHLLTFLERWMLAADVNVANRVTIALSLTLLLVRIGLYSLQSDRFHSYYDTTLLG